MPIHLQRILLTIAIITAFTLIFQDIEWGLRLAAVLIPFHLLLWGFSEFKKRRNAS